MTADPTRPDHLLDLDEWADLPEDTTRRIELAEGVLVVSPRPRVRHQRVVKRLLAHLDDQAAGRWDALGDVEVVVDAGGPATVRVPDVVLARPDVPGEAARLDAAQVLAVVEVLSPGSHRLDRVLKAHEYAAAGIPSYLVVDPGPPVTLTEFALVEGTYRVVTHPAGRAATGLGVVLDLDALG